MEESTDPVAVRTAGPIDRVRVRAVRNSTAAVVTLVVVTFATAVSSNLGFAFGVLGPVLRQDLHLSRAVLGLLSTVFFASTGCASIAAGRLVGRWGSRASVMTVLLAVCVMCVLAATVGDYDALLVAAVVAGAGYALVNVATNRVVRSVSDDAHLGTYMAVKTSGVPIATTTAALVGGVTAHWGWRPTILMLAGGAAVAFVLAAARLPEVSRTESRHRDHRRLPKGFMLLPLAGFMFVAGSQPLYTWFVAYLHESLGVDVGFSALMGGVSTAVGIPAMVAIARLADRFGERNRARFIAGLCAITAAALLLVLGGSVLGVAVAVAGVAIGASANLAVAGLFPALIVECAPTSIERGTGTAMAGYFAGALAAPVGFGALADATGGYTVPWIAGCVALVLATVLFVMIGRRFGMAVRLAAATGRVSPPVTGV
jgi:predicted MFS family arabinose efflux permease